MRCEQLKEWRVCQGFTQLQAAEELGISLSAYSQYESGVRRDDGQPTAIPRAIEKACVAFDRRAQVKKKIRDKIKSNGAGQITGQVLQDILVEIVDAM